MSILKTLPAAYRFTEADVDRAMQTQFGDFVNPLRPDPTEQEWELSVLAFTANEMHRILHCWPTLAEVLEYTKEKEGESKRLKEERERRYEQIRKLWGK